MTRPREVMLDISDAACRTPRGIATVDLVFARGDTLTARTFARVFCGRCPIKQECQDIALTRREEYGVWGGLTPKQRRNLLAHGWQTCTWCKSTFAATSAREKLCSRKCRMSHKHRNEILGRMHGDTTSPNP